MLMTFIMHLEDEAAAFKQVAGLVCRVGLKFRSLSAGEINASQCLRIVLQVATDDNGAAQLKSQLGKLPSVKKIEIVSRKACVLREFAIIKVSATCDERAEIMQIASVFRAQVIDISRGSLILEATGSAAKINALVGALEIYGIIEIARSGHIGMIRGVKVADSNGDSYVLEG
jgi:acetolactate synthase-1/3 small subunit